MGVLCQPHFLKPEIWVMRHAAGKYLTYTAPKPAWRMRDAQDMCVQHVQGFDLGGKDVGPTVFILLRRLLAPPGSPSSPSSPSPSCQCLNLVPIPTINTANCVKNRAQKHITWNWRWKTQYIDNLINITRIA
jgi:hypothetical protein